MNVNDLICVGAEPIAMLDFILCREADPGGLRRDRRRPARAAPSWPGSRSPAARSPRSATSSPASSSAGSAIGLVDLDAIVDGGRVEPGDAVIGLPSTGLHSNGYTLARTGRSRELALDDDRLGRPLGEVLLEPTEIYVRAGARAARLRRSTSAASPTSPATGSTTSPRLAAPVGYEIDDPLAVPPVFELIAELGEVADEEMYEVFNMGCGFVCVVAARRRGRRRSSCCAAHYPDAKRIGTVTDRAGVVERR